MEFAHRYAALLNAPDGMLREAPAEEFSGQKSELELQAHWFAGDFGTNFLTATTGERVEIIQFGVWNHEAGPDFTEAAVRFPDRPDAPVLRGCIELDTRAEDWERHGHGGNAAFDAVILHLYLQQGTRQPFTRTSQHRQVAQVQLDLRQLEHRAVPAALPAAKPGRCVGPLRDRSPAEIGILLSAAAQYRLQLKNRRWQRLVAVRGYDQALFQSLAVTLGYKENKLPFALLAQRLPLRTLHTEAAGTMALLLGVSGFLTTPGFSRGPGDGEVRAYLRSCWEVWWRRRTELARLILPAKSWTLSGLRPVNHPQRRLAALAQLSHQWSTVRALIDDGTDLAAKVTKFLIGLRDPFWDYQYTLASSRSARPMALIGATRASEMLANVFFPLAIATNPARWEAYAKLPARSSNRRVATAALRLFGYETERATPWLKTAAHQQGLLQIYEDFCLEDDSDCAQCTFPERVCHFAFKRD